MNLKLTQLTLFAFITLGLSANWSTAQERYRVQSGDDLGAIGQRFDVPFQEIMAANKLPNATIFVGQELLIPTKKRVATSAYNPPKPSTRITAPNAPIPVLKSPPGYNQQPPANQNLKAPSVVQKAPSIAPPHSGLHSTPHYRGSTYVVERGDSVRSISKKFGVAFWDLRAENDLLINRLTPGMTLKIPTRPSTVGVAF